MGLPLLPPEHNFNSPLLLRSALQASRKLAELNGVIKAIPNAALLLEILTFKEAKTSNEVENIVTTYDKLFMAKIPNSEAVDSDTREVKNYVDAINLGHKLVDKRQSLTLDDILAIQKINHPDAGEVRRGPVELRDSGTGKTVYTPPHDYDEIMGLLANLEQMINEEGFLDADPLIKMAIIHYQFEAIHPFSDGNGRMGRMLCVLYLILKGLLDLPVLYLSQYVIDNRDPYYELLRNLNEQQSLKNWEAWILWLLEGVEHTAGGTISKINLIMDLMQSYKIDIRSNFDFYSRDLVQVLFRYPYTVIELMEQELQISRPTAAKYLNQLSAGNKYLVKMKEGRRNYYYNSALLDILLD